MPKSQSFGRISAQEVKIIIKKGFRYNDRFFRLSIKKNPSSNNLTPKIRICISISSKIYPRAVDRNLLKRRLIEIIRTSGQFQNSSFDLIISPNQNFIKIPYSELQNLLLNSIHLMLNQYHEPTSK